MKTLKSQLVVLLLCIVCGLTGAYAQLTPSADAYTSTATPTTNFGAKTLLDVESASQTAYIQFDLSAIPAGYTSADITKAMLKLYVNAVSKAGSFNVDYVNGTWSESTIDASNAPALGTTIAASIPLTTSDKNQYILIDITPAVQAWLSGTANDGIALVGNSPVNATFDSKESTTTSHSAELDIVFTPGSGGGIAGIKTANGSGLMGGGNSGTLNLSLINTCAAKQILQWSGSAWACASPSGSGTVTSVGSGAGLTGGPITGAGTLSIATAGVSNAMLANPSLTISPGTAMIGGGSVALGGNTTLNLDTSKVPLLAASNTFSTNQTINGTLTAISSVTAIAGNSTGTGTVAVTGSGNDGGVLGYSAAGSGNGYGVKGQTESTSGVGVYGISLATMGTTYGVYGSDASISGFGVYGAGPYVGVYGDEGGNSVEGEGIGHAGVWGDTGGTTGSYTGVLGTADDNPAGYFANAAVYPTIFAKNDDPNFGGEVFLGYVPVVSAYAIIGDPGCNTGFIALQLGQSNGMSGCSNYTLTGGNNGHTYINAVTGAAVHIRINSVEQMAVTSGNVDVLGTLSKGGGSFKIDHPLDPANKYLYHSFVESPDMMNIYNGNVTTDASGEAAVELPEWFETLNRDFRYQLTVIGQFAQAIVAGKVANHRFVINTDKPNVEVSWQVTGIRQDAFANAHRIPVEAEKAPADRGHYLYPDLVGALETARIGYMAPAPGSEHVVHNRPVIRKPDGAAESQRTSLHVPVSTIMSHPPIGKLTVNQK